MSADALKLLCSGTKLERDRGLQEIQRYLACAKSADIRSLEATLLGILEDPTSPWESKLGGLLGIKALVVHLRSAQHLCDKDLPEKIARVSLELLSHPEVRLRLEAGQVLGVLCANEGVKIYEKCCSCLFELIESSLEREISEAGTPVQDGHREEEQEMSSAARILLNTAGWRHLETNVKCLQSMVEGCGSGFGPFVDRKILELLFRTAQHVSRFVRETTFYVVSSLVTCCAAVGPSNPFLADHLGHRVSRCLAVGLADNWSQVRLASSEATRKFLLSFSEKDREPFFPELLPQMCLNRYYTADGVRIYSQETWRRIAKTEGRELVQRHITRVVDYYISQTSAENHAIREAACACIAELASKINQDAVRPFVPKLLDTLVICFQDESWAVRDAACLACGNFLLCYPEESKSSLKALYPLFFDNLQDCIPSVRQGAASALGNVARAYGTEALCVLQAKVLAGLEGVKQQPKETLRYERAEWGNSIQTPASSIKAARDNDPALHTNLQTYSCESLQPKPGLCTDWKYRKPPEPWELADGCIHLVAELSQIPQASASVVQCVPTLAEAARHRHYIHHVALLETLCKQLPNIVKGVGKRAFRPLLEPFLDSIFYSLSCENALTSSAASQCLNQLSSLLGPSILRARVEQWNPRYLEQLDANLHIAGL
ncbi:unnamed protein product [Ixodes persulcatus]